MHAKCLMHIHMISPFVFPNLGKLILTLGDTLLFGVLAFVVAIIVLIHVGCVTVQVWLLGSSNGNYERYAAASLCLDIIASVSSWLSTSYLCLLKERTLQNSLSQGDICRCGWCVAENSLAKLISAGVTCRKPLTTS